MKQLVLVFGLLGLTSFAHGMTSMTAAREGPPSSEPMIMPEAAQEEEFVPSVGVKTLQKGTSASGVYQYEDEWKREAREEEKNRSMPAMAGDRGR